MHARVNESVTVELPAELGSAEAEELRLRCIAAFDADQPLCLAAASVRRIGTAALQVLAAVFVEGESAGRVPAWQHPSEALLEAATTAGLSQLLKLKEN